MIFKENIKKAIDEIKLNNFLESKEYIHLTMLEDDTSPKAHNLLGIIAEISGDLSLSGKHYRAAYALDPTFKPASINLERITSFNYIFNFNDLNYGDIG